jgi:signal transduction histidine kinase
MGSTSVPLAEPPTQLADRQDPGTAVPPHHAGLLRRHRRSHLLNIAVILPAGGLCALVQGSMWHDATVLAVVNVATSLTFLATGLLLRLEPGQRAVAFALILAGLGRSLDFANSFMVGPWPLYALVLGGMDRLAGAYALLRYPGSLLRYQRIFLLVLTAWMLVGRSLIAVTSQATWYDNPASSWWPALWPDHRLTAVINAIVNIGQGVLAIVLIVLLVQRLSQTKGLDRIVITPVIGAGLAAVVAASVTAVAQLLTSMNSVGPNYAYIAEGIVDLAVPLAFLVAAIQSGLLLRNIAALLAQISAGADVHDIRYALRAALRDPTLEVLDLSADGAGPDGTTGAPADGGPREDTALALAGELPPDRLVELIRTEGGTPIAVVIADSGLARYRGLFNAAVQTSGLALKNAQLHEQAARAELGQVRASRVRLVEAGLAGRRRLERDLHDGVQQHLLALAAQLSAAMAGTDDPVATAAFQQARAELTTVLAELRNLAHGIHPAVLTHSGLTAALEDMAERLPLPVRVTASGPRVSPAVEATAYFVASEALANVVKHAQASSAAVLVSVAGSWLDMEISDDGIGGAGTDGAGTGGRGWGMANMLDRVGALDGAITIDSPAGQGTRVLVRIPCA